MTDYHIRCPRCRALADWNEAFDPVPTRHGKPVQSDDPRPVHQWGGWWLREQYPSVIKWRPPKGRSNQTLRRGEFGVVLCSSCHLVAPHSLRWPADAYFQWSIRGTALWAWNHTHARVLLDYVASHLRDPWRYVGGYGRSLQKLPAPILAARNRDLVTRRITELLRHAAISLVPPLRSPPIDQPSNEDVE